MNYRNSNLGLATKTRVCKGVGQEWARESHFMLPKVQKNVREWTLTLPNELPFWELESQWTFEFSKHNCKGQNSLDWRIPYIIRKLLECKCLKWARMTHLGYLKHKLWANWQFDSRLLKVRNCLNSFMCRWHATYR
jgi:hypothetical protein